jgi:vitamin B12 transport system substrate-binding protein
VIDSLAACGFVKKLLLVATLIFCTNSYAKDAKRIIALSPHSVEMLFAIGAGDRIVGTTESSDYPAEALNILRIGNYTGIQIEKVVELQPDLIVAWKGGNKLADLQKLESLGFNVVDSHPNTFQAISDDLIKLGVLTGLEKSAKKQADLVISKHQAIKAKYKNKRKVNVFYQLWDDPLRTVGPKSWVDALINDCNGNNIFHDAGSTYPLISMESVLTRNPQVIIVQHHKKGKSIQKGIWNKWGMIDAVKNDHLYTIDPDILLRPTPRAIDGLDELCKAIDKAR